MPASIKPEPRWARNVKVANYLGISGMTFWRWCRDPELNFPAPTVVNGFELRDLNEVDAWMKSMIRRPGFVTRNKRKQKLIDETRSGNDSNPRRVSNLTRWRQRKAAEA